MRLGTAYAHYACYTHKDVHSSTQTCKRLKVKILQCEIVLLCMSIYFILHAIMVADLHHNIFICNLLHVCMLLRFPVCV